MSYKKVLTAGVALLLAGAAHAQTAGSTVVSLGWFRLMPNSSASPLMIDTIGGRPVNLEQPNTGAEIAAANTVGLSLEHFITDHIAAEFVLGLPPKHDVTGEKEFARYGEIGTVRQWSPAVLVKYHFLSATSKFRPYVGLGVNYTWFTSETITNQQFVHERFGPNASMTASAKSSWNPVFNVGANYKLSERWTVGLSVSYLPLSTTAALTTTNSAYGGATITSHTKIKINPLVTFLNVGYRF